MLVAGLVTWAIFGTIFGGLVLTVVVLIDCLTNEPSKGNTRVVWAIIIVVLNLVGALIYLFVRRPQRVRELDQSGPAQSLSG